METFTQLFLYNFKKFAQPYIEVKTVEKETYYISIKNLTCNRCATYDSMNFKIELEPHKARIFHKLFQQLYALESRAFIPVGALYTNNAVDTRYKKIYALLHEFGDEETKNFVEQLPYFS